MIVQLWSRSNWRRTPRSIHSSRRRHGQSSSQKSVDGSLVPPACVLGKANACRTLRFRRGAGSYASPAYLHCAFGMMLLRRCYYQVLRPRLRFPKFADRLRRHSDVWVYHDPHLIWQSTKSYVEGGNAFGLVPHDACPFFSSRSAHVPYYVIGNRNTIEQFTWSFGPERLSKRQR
jgi:hypothetical protein